ncbi:MAG: hypothetical protein JKX95_08045 [Bacteroidia bacterium]|nr:hypothetical protein [Bacteroidia bacterium]
MKANKIVHSLQLITTILCALLSVSAIGQDKIQVVTKTIEKQFEYTYGQTIELKAEKANVMVTGTKGNKVALQVQFIAKHPSKAVAERELSYLKFGVNNRDRTLELTNFIAIPKEIKGVESKLEIRFILSVPDHCNLKIYNRYGRTGLSDVVGDILIDSRFGNVSAGMVGGKVELITHFGELEVQQLSGTASIISQKTKIRLLDVNATLTVESKYGKCYVGLNDGCNKDIKIISEKAEVRLYTNSFDRFNYDLTGKEVSIPDLNTEVRSRDKKATFKKEFNKTNKEIKISTTNYPVIITTNKQDVL